MQGHQPLVPKPPSTPRNPLNYNTKRYLEKNINHDKSSDDLEQILNKSNFFVYLKHV